MNVLKKAAAVAAMGLAGAMGTVQAATITFSDTIALTLLPLSDTLDFSQFNPALGTLTGVQLTFSITLVADQKAENIGANSGTINLSSTLNATIANAGLGFSTSVAPVVSNSVSVGTFDGTIDFGGTSGATFLGGTNTACYSAACALVSQAVAPGYIGLGLVSFNVNGSATNGGTGLDQLIQQFGTRGSATGTIVYTYTPACGTQGGEPCPTPEPGVVSLLGLGLVGLLLARRRKHA